MLSLKRPDVFLFLRASAEGEEHSAKDQSRLCQLQALAPLAPACLASQVPLCLLTPRLSFVSFVQEPCLLTTLGPSLHAVHSA